MRRALGCVILLASVMLTFAVIGAVLTGRALSAGASVNLPLVALALLVAFGGYLVGMVLLTSLPSERRRR